MELQKHRPLIAVVDDDEFICRAVKRILGSNEMEVVAFTSGTGFIFALDDKPTFVPECVILDVHMPDMTGFEVLKLLTPRRPGIPVIFVTADPDFDHLSELRAAGAMAVFQKPVPEAALVNAIRFALS